MGGKEDQQHRTHFGIGECFLLEDAEDVSSPKNVTAIGVLRQGKALLLQVIDRGPAKKIVCSVTVDYHHSARCIGTFRKCTRWPDLAELPDQEIRLPHQKYQAQPT